MTDKEWYEQTKAKVEAWLSSRGFDHFPQAYVQWTHTEAEWRVSVEPGFLDTWHRGRDFKELRIEVRARRNFTKKIFRKTDKTDEVLAKLDAKLTEAINEELARKAAAERRNRAAAFQAAHVQEHLPMPSDVRFKTYGDSPETFRIDLDINGLTTEQAKRVIEALNGSAASQPADPPTDYPCR